MRALLLLLLALPVLATVIRVPQDVAGIQMAMDASADGDTVLVDRGIWTGLYTSPVHTLTLCSNYLFTGDSTDINETILDGEYAGTILDILSGPEDLLTLCGFTMRRGLGTRPDIYAYCDKGGALNMEGTANAVIRDMVFRECRAPIAAAILNHGNVCSGAGALGRLTLRNVACFDNVITAPSGSGGCINIRSADNVLIIDRLYYDGNHSSSDPIYVLSNLDSVSITNVTVVNCDGGLIYFVTGTTTQNGLNFANIHVSGCALGLAMYHFDIDSSVARVRNIEVSGYNNQEQVFTIQSQPTTLDIDSLTITNNRSIYDDAWVASIRSNVPGTLRHLHMAHNVTGDSISHPGKTMLYLNNISLLDSYIHDNRIIIAPNADPGAQGGNWVDGAMVRAYHEGTAHFENLVFENNRVEDLDDYSDLSPQYAYIPNFGRELNIYSGGSIVMRNILIRNSRQPNHCPEIYAPTFMTESGPSYCVVAGDSLMVDNLIIEDCDDGGIWGYGPSLNNITVRNVGRSGIQCGVPGRTSLRNIFIENVDGADDYLPPSFAYLCDQAAVKVYADTLDLDNVTISGCDDLRHLLRFAGGSRVRASNSLFWSNESDQFVQIDTPGTVSWNHCLAEQALPGEDNLVGEPLFDAELDPPYLSPLSPCIDAGNPDPAWNDREDSANPGFALWPSQGGLRNDIGFTGGPLAALPDTAFVGPLPVRPIEPRTQPNDFALGAPWPNPFNPVTQIPYTLSRPMPVTITVHNLLGQQVAVLVNSIKPAGTQQVAFEGSRLASGVYLVTLQAAGRQETRSVTLLR